MNKKQNILISGATGFLGTHLLQAHHSKFKKIALAHLRPFQKYNHVIYETIDITESASLEKLFSKYRPSSFIHLAAIADANVCENNTEKAYAINVAASKNIAQICEKFHAKLIYTSTDLVFDGKKGNYIETDKTNPLSIYGKHKAEAEKIIAQHASQFCILRMPLMFGEGTSYAPGFMSLFLENLRVSKIQKLFIDEFRSPLYVQSAAKGIMWALENNWQGIFHLAGIERLSRYELGCRICKHYNISVDLLQKVRQQELKMAAPRPADVSLNAAKAYSLGFRPESPF